MKRKLFLAFLVSVVLATSCKKSLKEIKTSTIELGEIKQHIVNSSQAQKVAVLNSIFPEPLKRGMAKNSGKGTLSVPTVVQKQKKEKSINSIFSLKEGQVHPTLHVINYSEGGWVIVSGDDRMEPILAFSDTGKFIMTSISQLRPGVNQWMDGNHRYISDLRSGKVHRSLKDSLGVKALWKDFEDKSEITKGNYSVLTEWPLCNEFSLGETHSTTVEYGPWTISKWDQGEDVNSIYNWNTYCPTESCSPNRTKVGCVGVSIAQIMYFHQYGAITGYPSLNWAAMDPDTATLASTTLLVLCADIVNTNYGCGSSSAGFVGTNNAFWGFGYSSANSSNFDYSDAASELASGYPIILAANKSFWVGGHQWVADGVKYMETYTCTEVTGIPQEGAISSKQPQTRVLPPGAYYAWVNTWANSYFRMNWGWGGSQNAWYSATVWTVGGVEYDYAMKMCIGIRP